MSQEAYHQDMDGYADNCAWIYSFIKNAGSAISKVLGTPVDTSALGKANFSFNKREYNLSIHHGPYPPADKNPHGLMLGVMITKQKAGLFGMLSRAFSLASAGPKGELVTMYPKYSNGAYDNSETRSNFKFSLLRILAEKLSIEFIKLDHAFKICSEENESCPNPSI